MDKENEPAKVAQHAQALVVRSEDIRDTEEDLETQPVQVKRSTPRKPFGSILENSNDLVNIPTKAHHFKLWYDPVTGMNCSRRGKTSQASNETSARWCCIAWVLSAVAC